MGPSILRTTSFVSMDYHVLLYAHKQLRISTEKHKQTTAVSDIILCQKGGLGFQLRRTINCCFKLSHARTIPSYFDFRQWQPRNVERHK